ncbi:MAG: hypothetical protein VXZ84_06490 [Planctomycetota bacterium]|nr:hypothetical protein [Planctomycetota bacterium]
MDFLGVRRDRYFYLPRAPDLLTYLAYRTPPSQMKPGAWYQDGGASDY